MSNNESKTFEIGLVLAGAISAGAYTAGVLDFLIESLENYEKIRQKFKKDFPNKPELHKVKIKACLIWLANFYAKYLNTKSELLWKIGTYCHLDTRPDELEVLENKELKYFAKQIDTKLKNAKYLTIVHGDAKLANFCFSENGINCAAVDFQYVGHGCGMKDLVYFMSSALESKDCAKMQNWILDTYFLTFHNAMKFYFPKVNSLEIEQEWRVLFPIAWADFQRFIKGWSPNHYKINSYSKSQTTKALKLLKFSS